MSWLHTGEFYSLATAVVWAVAVILFRQSGLRVPPVPLNLFKDVVGIVLVSATMLLLGIEFWPAGASRADWAVLLASGLLGIGISDSLFFASLNRLGAGRAAIVDCLYSPSVLLFSTLLLREPVRWTVLAAIGLMVTAILLGSWAPRRGGPAPPDAHRIRAGVGLGVLSMISIAVAIVLAKPVLDRSDAWWVTFVRLLGGLAILAVQGASRRHRRQVAAAFRPGPAWRVMLPGAFLGMYLSLFLWTMGMKLTQTTIASVLNQVSNIFIMLLAWLLLHERLGARQWVAIGLGFSAAALVAL